MPLAHAADLRVPMGGGRSAVECCRGEQPATVATSHTEIPGNERLIFTQEESGLQLLAPSLAECGTASAQKVISLTQKCAGLLKWNGDSSDSFSASRTHNQGSGQSFTFLLQLQNLKHLFDLESLFLLL